MLSLFFYRRSINDVFSTTIDIMFCSTLEKTALKIVEKKLKLCLLSDRIKI